MDLIPLTGSIRRQWRRRGYSRLSPTRRTLKTVRFGGSSSKRSWKVKIARKLRLIQFVSPLRLLMKLKNSYVSVMLRLANSSNTGNSRNVFGGKRIPKAREAQVRYSRSEFESRLVQEIYKSMVASLELGYTKMSL